MARLIFPKHWEGFANEGERKVIEFLAHNLPVRETVMRDLSNWGMYGDEFIVIPNFTLPERGGMSAEIDGVVIAPHAVYLIETKDWNGRIVGDEQEWVLNERSERPNPNHSISLKAKKLAGALERVSADIKRNVFFTHLVIIVNPETELQLSGPSAKTTYTLDQKLIQYIQDFSRLDPKLGRMKIQQRGIKLYQQEILDYITRREGKKHGPKLINGYQVTEELLTTPNTVEYLAHLQQRQGSFGSVKRLRVFRLPLHLPPNERKKREEQIYRDYKALDLVGNHPNIVALRGEPMEHNADQIVEVLDWSEEGTLRSVLKQGTLTFEQSLEIVQGIAQGLKALHEVSGREIIHRDLRPENILMRQNTPQLMNFDKAYLYKEGHEFETVYAKDDDEQQDLDRSYLPPELDQKDYQNFPSSDLYSLGVIFYELLVGQIPYPSPDALIQAGGKLPPKLWPTEKAPGLPSWVNDLVNRLYCADESERFQSASEFLEALKIAQSEPTGERTHPPTSIDEAFSEQDNDDPNRIFQAGERIESYRVQRLISSGAFAQVYQVTHIHRDQFYALKVYNDSAPIDNLRRELNLLSRCHHPYIVQVDWSGQVSGGRHWIVMEYLDGEPLSKYTWSKNSQKKLPLQKVIEAGLHISSALKYLHSSTPEKGQILHRDVKPNNIIWVPERGFILIDFNIGVDKSMQEARTEIGTTPYIPPDRWHHKNIDWEPSCDTYALGVTLYELACKNHPYPNKDAKIDSIPEDPRSQPDCGNLSPELASFLQKAVMPQAEQRFQTAEEMENALLILKEGPLFLLEPKLPNENDFNFTPEEAPKANYNPFVNRLRRLFSQARFNNAGTRGLDEIGKRTYIPTRLDQELVPAILDGQFKLVIITGNAGDGKTALIQQIESALQAKGNSVQNLPTGNGSKFNIKGVPFETNYDGSQDEGDLNNDEVLERFLAPFSRVKDLTKVKAGRILAINEGRLVEFLASPERRKQFGFLYEQVERYFNERATHDLPEQMIMINLNWRSIVAIYNQTSLLEKQLETLLKPDFWQACQSCEHRAQCFIFANVQALGDPAAGFEIRRRLREIFEGVHLRRELHMTMRDLRSALAWLLLHDKGCDEIAQDLSDLKSIENRIAYLKQYYWNLTDPTLEQGKQDRLIQRVQALDVGQVADPGSDRDLYFLPLNQLSWLPMEYRETDTVDFSLQLLQEIRQENQKLNPEQLIQLHRLLVRKVYFEGLQETQQRLPYMHLEAFKAVLSTRTDKLQEALETVVYAISLSETCRNLKLAKSYICLSANNSKDPRYASFRLFSINDFEIKIPELGKLGQYLEHKPDRFLLQHRDPLYQSVILEVNLDLFELLNHISRGFTPSMNDLQGHFIELIIFKNALKNLPYRSVLVTEDHQQFFQVSATPENHLSMEQV
jgi:serine/threonine protein kinase